MCDCEIRPCPAVQIRLFRPHGHLWSCDHLGAQFCIASTISRDSFSVAFSLSRLEFITLLMSALFMELLASSGSNGIMLHFRDCFQNTYICSHATAIVQASALWNALGWRLVSDRRPSLSGIAFFPLAGSVPRVPIDSSPITALSMAGERTAHAPRIHSKHCIRAVVLLPLF